MIFISVSWGASPQILRVSVSNLEGVHTCMSEYSSAITVAQHTQYITNTVVLANTVYAYAYGKCREVADTLDSGRQTARTAHKISFLPFVTKL